MPCIFYNINVLSVISFTIWWSLQLYKDPSGFSHRTIGWKRRCRPVEEALLPKLWLIKLTIIKQDCNFLGPPVWKGDVMPCY